MFHDYLSTFDELTQNIKKNREVARKLLAHGVDVRNFRSVYSWLLGTSETKNSVLSRPITASDELMLCTEGIWYHEKRPFFNVYPLIEKKFLELPVDLPLSELVLPFESLEIRTNKVSMLLGDGKEGFALFISLNNLCLQLKAFKGMTLEELFTADVFLEAEKRTISRYGEFIAGVRRDCVMIAIGVCLLAKDKSIVEPVILNKHRKENMTPAEIADYAQRAINRTGRVGFEVGKTIERMKATIHYRNGCFAKYYVGKDHECYPDRATADKVPIIKWRSGAVVNKDNPPKIPTGFKDLDESKESHAQEKG